MILVVKVVHVVFAAAWFGHKLLIPGNLRAALHSRDDVPTVVKRMARAERLGIASGLITVLSGLYLIYLTTGFADAPIRIYLGLTGAVAMIVVGATLAGPAWKHLRTALESGDYPGAFSRLNPFIRGLRLENLLWVAVLTAMLS